ncbi:MAG TPA: DUF308 domain-containing protein [Polyangiaceae bacterium]|nr:DUF308 domain-containing protein [Polyangiaceae bacterium]
MANKWLTLALRGVLGIVVGATLLAWGNATFGVVVVLFGFYTLVDGMLAIGHASRAWLFMLEGLAGIAVGLAVLLASSSIGPLVLPLIASWALATGVIEIAAATRLRGEPMLVAAGCISLALGLTLFAWRGAALVLVFLLGSYALLFGTAMFLTAMRMRRGGPHEHGPLTVGQA